MRIQITDSGQITELELGPGLATLGGVAGDAIRVEGLLPSFLLLNVDGDRLHVKAKDSVKVGGTLCPPRVVRLLLPGEVVELPNGAQLRLAADPARSHGAATVAVLRDLFSASPDASTSRAATLTCVTGLDMGRCFVLNAGSNEIGRGEKAPLKIRDRSVSRSHARVTVAPEACTIEDLGSPNGVFVNGHAVRAATRLAEGDIVELGQTLLRFSAPMEEKQPAAKPDVDASRVSRVTVSVSVTKKHLGFTFPHAEWAIIALGALVAIAGALVSWRLTL